MKNIQKVLLIVLIILFFAFLITNVYFLFLKRNNQITVYKIEEKIKNDANLEGMFFKTNDSLFLVIVLNTHRNFDEHDFSKLELYSEKDNELLKKEYNSKHIILNDYDLYHEYLDKNIKLYLKIYYKDETEEKIDIEFNKIYQNNLKNKNNQNTIFEKIEKFKNKLILNMEPQINFYLYEYNDNEIMVYMPEDNLVTYYNTINKNEFENYYFYLNNISLYYTYTVDDKEVETYNYTLNNSTCTKDNNPDCENKKDRFEELLKKIIS